MSISSKLEAALGDLQKGGLSFFLSGMFSKVSRAKTVVVKLPGEGQVSVRPGQSDFFTVRQVFISEDYHLWGSARERIDREYERICANGMVPVIIDAGANIGAATIWLKRQFPKASIVAVEPDPGNAAMTRGNVANLTDVIVLEAAIGGEPGFVTMVPTAHAWAVKTRRADAGCEIITIDQAVAMVPSGKLLMAKIDIEGFESDLFDGDLRWMEDVSGVFIEPHDWMLPGKGSSRSFQAAFGERDFEIFLRGENLLYVRRESQSA